MGGDQSSKTNGQNIISTACRTRHFSIANIRVHENSILYWGSSLDNSSFISSTSSKIPLPVANFDLCVQLSTLSCVCSRVQHRTVLFKTTDYNKDKDYIILYMFLFSK